MLREAPRNIHQFHSKTADVYLKLGVACLSESRTLTLALHSAPIFLCQGCVKGTFHSAEPLSLSVCVRVCVRARERE